MFIPRRFILHYLIIYAAIFGVYPLSNILERSDSAIFTIIGIFSGYLLAFFLYIFLSVLVTDIFLLLNLIFGFIHHERLRSWKFRSTYFFVLLGLSTLIVICGVINFNTIRISEYSISVPEYSSSIKKLRIAFVSDFHLEKTVPPVFVRRFVRKVNEENPDILLYGGDILEGSSGNMNRYEKMLAGIHPPFGVYSVRGNHDRLAATEGNFFKRAGIVLLRDSVVVSVNGFSIAGREEAGNHNRLSASAIASEAPDSLPLILLDHRPDEPDQISRTHADIAFSGHSHNGQLFPLNFYLKKVYQLSHGYMSKGNTQFFVSSGIRLWGPRVRTTGKSEIMIVNVDFK